MIIVDFTSFIQTRDAILLYGHVSSHVQCEKAYYLANSYTAIKVDIILFRQT